MLTLIPTPINDNHPLEQVAYNKLNDACKDTKSFICVEEAKVARRRWISWGLPKEAIQDFIIYNEHTALKENERLLGFMQSGNNIYLLSDCGLPAFCDPGQKLINLCHKRQIKITSTPFPNSVALAIALSGFDANKFVFEGFISKEKDHRGKELTRIMKSKKTTVIMDTPYRLNRLIDELRSQKSSREVFLAMDLGDQSEELIRSKLCDLTLPKCKREFVLILAPINTSK